YPLDGRVSSYPEAARGFSASNCYLLTEPDAALMLDTGYPGHERSILGQLGSLIDKQLPLSLYPLRINEFMSVCNAGAISRAFNVVQCYAGIPNVGQWLDFSVESLDAADGGGANRQGAGNGAKGAAHPKFHTTLVGGELQELEIGASETRIVDAIQAPIRLIGTRWIYDGATRTLFSSDMFTHFWRDSPDGPWVLRETEDTSTEQHLRSFLLNTRYWWLEGAKNEGLRRGIAKVFDTYEIDRIAPGYGCILEGRDIVARQYQMLDDVLRKLDRASTPPVYAAHGVERH
ncbi:MAG TPA: hypothetical protein VF551_05825, partial [Chthoniobacterales bacterium]